MKGARKAKLRRWALALGFLALLGPGGTYGETPGGTAVVEPFERERRSLPQELDDLVEKKLAEKDLDLAPTCSDGVFLRRVYLDLIGTLPTKEEVAAFLDDKSLSKRKFLVEDLLERKEYAWYWSMKWCDLLRVKAEFPINLWPNGVQCYHRWLIESLDQNMPYDEFARKLLTSSGSNFRVGPVNFWRSAQGTKPADLAAIAALNFMGTRIDKWSAEDREGFEVFFSRVAFKPTAEWKEEIVLRDPTPVGILQATLPGLAGEKIRIMPDQDPREVFADWLITPDNPWFAPSIVNRAWYWLMGYGIVHEPDDFRPDNPPSNPELLAYLAKEFVDSGYDMKELFRLITQTNTYQQSSIPRSDHPDVGKLFGHYHVRRMEAEVLIDAICQITGTTEDYMSMVPEPFTYVPNYQRSILLADGTITSEFLEMFGRPSRDTGYEMERNNSPSDRQRLHLLNSTHINNKLQRGPKVRELGGVREIYRGVLSRDPTEAEMQEASGGVDLIWALINSKEFLYKH